MPRRGLLALLLLLLLLLLLPLLLPLLLSRLLSVPRLPPGDATAPPLSSSSSSASCSRADDPEVSGRDYLRKSQQGS